MSFRAFSHRSGVWRWVGLPAKWYFFSASRRVGVPTSCERSDESVDRSVDCSVPGVQLNGLRLTEPYTAIPLLHPSCLTSEKLLPLLPFNGRGDKKMVTHVSYGGGAHSKVCWRGRPDAGGNKAYPDDDPGNLTIFMPVTALFGTTPRRTAFHQRMPPAGLLRKSEAASSSWLISQ